MTARQKAARKRAAESRQQRLEQAIAQLPELKQKQAEAAQRAGKGKCGDQIRARQPRVSTTDAATRVMKMANGGYSPGVNVQLATDTESRAILGVEVSNEASDSAGLSEPMKSPDVARMKRHHDGRNLHHIASGTAIPNHSSERTSARSATAAVANRNCLRAGSSSVRMW